MFSIHTELQALTGRLQAENIPYALCGALALAVHGYPRATLDIDLLALEGSGERILQCGRALGFTPEAAPMQFADGAVRIRRLSKAVVEIEDVLMLDVLSLEAELEKEITTETLVWEGGGVTDGRPGKLDPVKEPARQRTRPRRHRETPMKDKSDLPTSAEITRRLRIVSELRNLCLSLGRAGRMGDAEKRSLDLPEARTRRHAHANADNPGPAN